MKLAFRVILLTVLVAVALTMATFTALSFRRAEERREQAGFVLGTLGDSVAVYAGNDRKHPLTVTDIPLSSLRRTDREKLEQGLSVPDRDALLELLEDLGG